MANDNNIKNFTASDIEKYQKGQLSAKEMHDLEKAALDDPFLADALDGYAVTDTNVNADIAELKKRLGEKTEQAKVIPLHTGGRSSFPWMRAAVLIVLIAGAGVLAYQFLFKTESDKKIAQSASHKNKEIKKEETAPAISRADSINSSLASTPGNKSFTDKAVVSENESGEQKNPITSNKEKAAVSKDSTTTIPGLTVTNPSIVTSSAEKADEIAQDKKIDGFAAQRNDTTTRKNDIALKDDANKVTLNKPILKDADGVADFYYKAKSEGDVNGLKSSKRSESPYRNANVFRGRVTDATNNALPFANITNRQDNVGTYSDAQGNFALVSPDTVLNVQVRSLGFENSNVQLKGLVTNNLVVMQEDKSLNARVLDTVKRNISRARNNTMTFEEPEPEDGWPAYQSYVLNNLNMPEKIDMKKSGETADNTVEVSFEVNKNGDPVNIKIEKSLCDKCDKEAIRLIKDGPKWKRKAKKGKRTTVAVPFIKP